MKTLIVEDDPTSRLLLMKVMEPYGPVQSVTNGKEALATVRLALESGEPYELICMDIMMPEMDGQAALKSIRGMEEKNGIPPGAGSKVIMTTALNNMKNVADAYKSLCDAYLTKPLDKGKLLQELRNLGLLAAQKTSV